jgi:signal peptidase I
MNLNFPLILVCLTAFTGSIALLDILFWAPRRRAKVVVAPNARQSNTITTSTEAQESKMPVWVETCRSLFPVILVVLLLRSFIVEPFQIPSESMMPTLVEGDFILVNKFTYGLRLPVLNNKVVALGEPQRGDVVVFRNPQNPKLDYIKRIVGLPGDRVVYRNKQLYINGVEVPRENIGDGILGKEIKVPATRYRESLGAVQHEIQILEGVYHLNDQQERDMVVPAGNYWVMGDNRDNSADSRVFGFMPEENLVGKAFMIWLNFSQWRRIGTLIK